MKTSTRTVSEVPYRSTDYSGRPGKKGLISNLSLTPIESAISTPRARHQWKTTTQTTIRGGKSSDMKTALRGHITLFDDTAMEHKTMRSNPLVTSSATFGRHTGEDRKNVDERTSLEKRKED